MIDVVQYLGQRVDPVITFSSHIQPPPATIATTTPSQASFGLDLTGEQILSTLTTPGLLDWNLNLNLNNLIAAMTFQQFNQLDQELSPSTNSNNQSHVSSPQQNSRQFTEMTAFSQFSTDNSSQQSTMLHQTVEPPVNYHQTPVSYNFSHPHPPPPSSSSSSSNSIALDNANLSNYSRSTYTQQHHQQNNNHQLISNYNFSNCLQQHPITPSSIGTNSCQHQQKQIPGSINEISSNFPRPTSISSNVFITPSYPNMVLYNEPSSQVFTTKQTPSPIQTTIGISQNSTTTTTSSSESTSPIKQTFNYGGPPKSYYSRLPLYDRPFKCDQCPQSFNRNHDLKRHKRIHLAVKPYPCQYCEKQFSRKDALKRHILVKGCNNNNKNKSVKPVNESSTTTIENYVDTESPIKTEPTNDNNGYGMSI